MEFAGELLHKSALESSAPAPPSRLHKSPAVDAWPQGQTSTPDPEIVREKFARKCYSWMRIIIIQESVKSKTFCKASDEEIEHEGRCGGIKFCAGPFCNRIDAHSLFLNHREFDYLVLSRHGVRPRNR